MRTRSSGRDVDRLLADFGHNLPARPAPGEPEPESRLFTAVPPHGRRQPGRGWSPASAPVSVWRMTADQAPVLWPLVASPAQPAGAM